MSYSDWNARVEWLLRQTGTRQHLPNNLPVRCIRHDGLMLECEGGDHQDYLFPVDAESTHPPEEVPGGHAIPFNQPSHALIYTDGNVALTLYECCYSLWHIGRDGEWISGTLQDESYRLSRESVDKIKAWYAAQGKGHLHPACQYEEGPQSKTPPAGATP